MNEGIEKGDVDLSEMKDDTPISELGKDCCPSCTTSDRWKVPGPAPGIVIMHPAWICTNPQSPHYEVWMSPIGACSEYELDQAKLDAINAPAQPLPRILRPRVRNRIIDNKSNRKKLLLH